jgi:hypothetical protein
LDSTTYELDYLIKDTLVAKQPCLLGGAKKALKTSIAIDMAISLATTTPFLGRFSIKRPCKTIVLSGESGIATLQETARRVCESKDVRLADIENLFWSTFLPRFNNNSHLNTLRRMIQETGCEVLIVDPCYLCMPGIDAANLFSQGALLRQVSDLCESNGVGLILAHHTKKGSNNQKENKLPELDDLAWAGFAEFARQWLLVGRREDFVPGSGEHKLWLSIGGSAGHSSSWAVDIEEGISGIPRHWEVTLCSADEARTEKKVSSLRERILNAAREFPNGETKTVILDAAKAKSNATTRAVFDSLVSDRQLVPHKVEKHGATYDGFRLAL